MIAAARDRAARDGAEIAFEVASANSLSLPSERFDRVLAVTVLCFIGDAAPALREMARVLRPGGRLVIGELGRWSAWALERRIRGWFGSPVWRHAHFRTERELRALATEAGLAAESVRGAIYYPPCGLAARLLAPCDTTFGRLTTAGAAFLALSATKSSAHD
jgi:SAM-dependent methyltransferase